MPHSNAVKLQPTSALLLSVLTVWLWIGIAALLNNSQLNDSLEQFIWAQSLEWGYWKHPPLTTWLMHVPLHIWGPHPAWPYVLSALVFAVTVVASFKITERLFDADGATWVALLLTLHYGFTRKAQLYNHNSVLIAFVALTVLATLYALRDQRTWQWLGVGLLAGLSLLVKYQAAVPLIGVLLAIAANGRLKQSANGLVWAGIICLAVLAPHVWWLTQHDFQALRYALRYLDEPDLNEQALRQGSFWVAQARYHLPMFFFVLILWAIRFVRPSPPLGPTAKSWSSEQKSWLVGLCIFPLGFIVFVSVAMGVRIQSQWGLQTTQFLTLALACWMLLKFGQLNARHMWAWALVQAVALFIFIGQGLGWILHANDRLAVRELPAGQMASRAMAFWNANTRCPLTYLSGDSAMSAMIAAYSGKNLRVLENQDPQLSPWIDLNDMKRSGYLEVAVQKEGLMAPDVLSIPYQLRSRQPASSDNSHHLVLKFHAPEKDCP
jgi:hypothetical protein